MVAAKYVCDLTRGKQRHPNLVAEEKSISCGCQVGLKGFLFKRTPWELRSGINVSFKDSCTSFGENRGIQTDDIIVMEWYNNYSIVYRWWYSNNVEKSVDWKRRCDGNDKYRVTTKVIITLGWWFSLKE